MKRGHDVDSLDRQTSNFSNEAAKGTTNGTVVEDDPTRQSQESEPIASLQHTRNDHQRDAASSQKGSNDLTGQPDTSQRQSRQESQDIRDELDRRLSEIQAKRRNLEAEVEKVTMERMVLVTLARDIDTQIGSLQNEN